MENKKPILMILEQDRDENIDVSLIYSKGKEAEIEEALLHTARENSAFRQIIESVYDRMNQAKKQSRKITPPKMICS